MTKETLSIDPISGKFQKFRLECMDAFSSSLLLVEKQRYKVGVVGVSKIHPLDSKLLMNVDFIQLESACEMVGLELTDIRCSVVTRSPFLSASFVVYSALLDGLKSDTGDDGSAEFPLVRTDIDPIDPVAANFELSILLTLEKNREPEEPLEPQLRHSILGNLEWEVRLGGSAPDGKGGFDIDPLTKKRRSDENLGSNVWLFIEEVESPLEANTYSDAVKAYVDPKILYRINEKTPASFLMREFFFLEVVSNIIMRLSQDCQKNDVKYLEDIDEGTLAWSLLQEVIPKKLLSKNQLASSEVFSLIKTNPTQLVYKLSNKSNIPKIFFDLSSGEEDYDGGNDEI
jgi:hypothetical protein